MEAKIYDRIVVRCRVSYGVNKTKPDLRLDLCCAYTRNNPNNLCPVIVTYLLVMYMHDIGDVAELSLYS